MSIIEEVAARRQTEVLVNQRGSTVLEGIAKRLYDRQRAKISFAQLLADQNSLSTVVEQENLVGLAQKLVPLKTKLGIGFINVYRDGQELLNLGTTSKEKFLTPVVNAALSGLTKSSVAVSSKGLTVFTATPIKGSQGIVGALLVGTTLDGEALKSIKERDAIELALFYNGSLVTTTTHKINVVELLHKSKFTLSELQQLNKSLVRFHFYATAKFLENGDSLLALVPTQDLFLASKQREVFRYTGTLGLVVAVLLIGLLLAQDIANPLETMVTATRDILRGNYKQRVANTSHIQELNDLADAINYLAQQLEEQLAKLTHQAFHDSLTNLPNRAFLKNVCTKH